MSVAGAPESASPETVAGRSCDGCTLCCKLMAVREINKPRAVWCTHCDKKSGCTIYDTRPFGCRVFYCGWMTAADLGPHWKPLTARMVLSHHTAHNWLVVHVDPGRPDAWRTEPYYSDLKAWSRHMTSKGGRVMVWQGDRVFAVLPDGDVDVGTMRDDEDATDMGRRRGTDGGPLEAAKGFAS